MAGGSTRWQAWERQRCFGHGFAKAAISEANDGFGCLVVAVGDRRVGDTIVLASTSVGDGGEVITVVEKAMRWATGRRRCGAN